MVVSRPTGARRRSQCARRARQSCAGHGAPRPPIVPNPERPGRPQGGVGHAATAAAGSDGLLPGLLSRSWLRDGSGVRFAVLLLILSCTVLQRFGLTVGETSLSAGLIAAYLLLLLALAGGELAVMSGRLALYCTLMLIAGTSLVLNHATSRAGEISVSSMLILGVMYLPFVFVLRPGGPSRVDAAWVLRAFSGVALFCAWAGIAQFGAQFVLKADWLFDFSPYLPAFLRSGGGYNVVIPVGDHFKSNGFFFKEPSLFSLVLAFGLLIEIWCYRRWLRIGAMALAMVLTYSGSGLIVLAAGLLFPLRLKTLARLAVIALVGGVAAALLWDVMNLGFTLGRVTEFSDPGASAYHRYVAPFRLIADSLSADPWSVWFGRGPGSIFRAGKYWGWFYEYHDPTFAKAFFEYGVLGLVAVVSLAASALRAPAIPPQLRVAVFVCWIGTGGFLVTAELTLLILVFGGVFATGRQRDPPAPASAPAPGPPARMDRLGRSAAG